VTPVRLRGEGVAKRFGRVTALRGIDFEIEPGEAVAILGANGAGKSTLLRIFAGLSRPSEGRFEAIREVGLAEREGGANGSADLARPDLRGAVGYVGHATLLYGELTARENLAFAARLQGADASPARLDGLLAELGLQDFSSRRTGTFSRGMAQRLAIARAIVHEPSVLLLDEPFTGLDAGSAERLSSQLSGLRARGRTLIVVTHDPQRGVELADRALVLDRGLLVAHVARQARPGAEDVPFAAEALQALLARFAQSVGSTGSVGVDSADAGGSGA